MAVNRAIDDDVREVLEGCRVEDQLVFLPDIQLDRTLYVKVNKALTDLGGKWNRKARAHVFKADPAAKLADALQKGETVNEQQLLQAFFTPKDVARMVAQWAEVRGYLVLEPSAGEGALAIACCGAHAVGVVCIEKHPPFVKHLRDIGFDPLEGDFLEQEVTQLFERIVMNPPFTKDQDVAHVRKALEWLSPEDGRLVAIMAGNTTRRRFLELRAEVVGRGWSFSYIELPEQAFKAAGTGVRTVVVTIEG